MNNFIHCINGFKELCVYYTDTDSIYILEDKIEILKQHGYYGKMFGQGKNDSEEQITIGSDWKLFGKDIEEFKQMYGTDGFSKDNCGNDVYTANFQIEEYRSIGPKQKIVKLKDTWTGLTKNKITFKGITCKDEYVKKLIGIEYFDAML